jgi:hypothetical protein
MPLWHRRNLRWLAPVAFCLCSGFEFETPRTILLLPYVASLTGLFVSGLSCYTPCQIKWAVASKLKARPLQILRPLEICTPARPGLIVHDHIKDDCISSVCERFSETIIFISYMNVRGTNKICVQAHEACGLIRPIVWCACVFFRTTENWVPA